ncbi:3' exoribonuclease family, domain 1 containing protein, putative [Babesia bigemina]|uniref:3' exoribonuclease family, domain 1 containing protein, putative n=1 Tax=Babesia bigemina TaxID=5866 RepID=A0A061DE27_BABBI|nr:3' exoribonuclease family, domain 1 containing protein, putative [Babesia bigemina]CDR97909.1 3' exoribonuclease family, domain 1 containing protein, putative [Babesia bigemina]|eukprot:XP_012770095.1 3' exoribonuclease family, domain 1 containing protein, putative [Babesia bigemina]
MVAKDRKALSIQHIDFLQLPEADTSTVKIGETLLHAKCRIDGRGVNQCRSLRVKTYSKPGHVYLSLGNTDVFVAVNGEISEPNLERPNEGTLAFYVEVAPMCSQVYEPGRQTEHELQILQILEKAFKDSGAVDVESLCIVVGRYVSNKTPVWSLRIDVSVQQNDGNLQDACVLAVLAALMTFRKPDTCPSAGDADAIQLNAYYTSPLSMYHTPIHVSVGLLEDAEHCIVDTNSFEELFVNTHVSLLFNNFGDLFAVQKHGGGAVTLERIEQAIEVRFGDCIST